MPPQEPPPLTPSPVEAVDIVTLTIYSSGSSTQSGLPTLSGGGGTSVPIAPIVGGAVGGVALAVLLVIIWKHWGRVIKRTERQRRKEVQDHLTMRENTRRNATSGFRPQSQYRPMFGLNRESRRVTFLTRAPTPQQRASKDDDNDNDNAAPSALAQTEGEKGQSENEGAVAPNNGGDIGSMDEIRQLSPNFGSSATPLLVREATTPAGAAAAVAGAVGSERKSESGERPLSEKELEAGMSTAKPISPPPPRDTTPSPPPIPSPTHTTPKRVSSPTPSGSTSKHTVASRTSRSVRMRTPKRLPDPPAALPPPMYVGRDHARPSSPQPRTSTSLPRTSSVGSSRTFDSGMRSTSPTPLLPPVPPVPVPPVPAVPPVERSTSSSSSSSPPSQPSWSRSPLRNSVLPSDHPVILPRPKNAPASQPVSPTSTLGHLPSLSGSMSQQSGGEQPRPSNIRFLGSLRRGGRGKSSAGTVRPISTQSSASAYSTND